jgi:ApaG protein
MNASIGSDVATGGVRVQTTPRYVPEESNPEDAHFVFSYHVRIDNHSENRLTLRRRHWVIIDAEGERRDVEGEGVVGQQPELEPGETFQYVSYCLLPTEWGTMEGEYDMEAPGGDRFDVAVGRFYLAARVETEAAAGLG